MAIIPVGAFRCSRRPSPGAPGEAMLGVQYRRWLPVVSWRQDVLDVRHGSSNASGESYLPGSTMIAVAFGLAAAFAIPFARSPNLRLWFVVFGAALVFQSSSGVSAPKLAYIAGLFLATAFALHEGTLPITRVALGTAALFGALTVMAVLRGNAPLLVLRDGSNYFLLLVATPLAVHFGRRVSAATISRATVAVGLFGCYAFVAQWITNRGLGSLPAVGLPSNALLGLGMAVACTRVIDGRSPGRWGAVATAIVASALLTGTRSLLLLMVIPLSCAVQVLRRSPQARRKAARSARTALVAIPIVLAVTFPIAAAIGVDTTAALDRIGTIGQASGSSKLDASLLERQNAQRVTWEGFTADPLLGRGPGTMWRSILYDGTAKETLTLDTSVVILAKWGIIGALGVVVFLAAWWRWLTGKSSPTHVRSVVTALAPFLLLQSILNAVVEDKGLPICLILLGAALVAEVDPENLKNSKPARSRSRASQSDSVRSVSSHDVATELT